MFSVSYRSLLPRLIALIQTVLQTVTCVLFFRHRPDARLVLHAVGVVDGVVRQAAVQESHLQRIGSGERWPKNVEAQEELSGPDGDRAQVRRGRSEVENDSESLKS